MMAKHTMRACALTLTLLVAGSCFPARAATYETLSYGLSGTGVKTMQKALDELDFYSGKADGKFGSGTLAAVKAFQKDQGLKVDGKAGTQTLTLLYSLAGMTVSDTAASVGSSATVSGSTSVKLVYGDSGTEVKNLQKALAALGYYSGKADGKFGGGTLTAVKNFQKAVRLTADGKAGTKTLTALYGQTSTGDTADTGSAGTTSSGVCTDTTMTHTIRSGHEGKDVEKVQNALIALGYLASGSATSVCDSATMAAVKKFQSRNSLTADGVAGTQTFTKLFSSSVISAAADTGSVTVPTTYTTLRSGAKGDAVKALQTYLSSLDYSVKITSSYDSQTITAVKDFQRCNNLTVDGVAGAATQRTLYSGSAKKYTASGASSSGSTSIKVPNVGQVKLLHWFDEVKPLLRGQRSVDVYDPASGYSFTLHLYSLGRHADVEPMTAADTANMMAAFGGKVTWDPKFVYVKLPNGQWCAATMHNVAHGGQSIKDNNFDGQNCVHFLRDMDEVSKNDPSYGVTNQNVLRKQWKALTGEVIE